MSAPRPAVDYSSTTVMDSYWSSWTGSSGTLPGLAGTLAYGNSQGTINPLRSDKTRAMAPFSSWDVRALTAERVRFREYQTAYPYIYVDWDAPSGNSLLPSDLLVYESGRDVAVLNAFASYADRAVQLSDALRHANQTARMVGDLGKGIAEGLVPLIERNAKGAKRLARNWRKLPDWYLAYLYGWKPLADDIENVVDKLSKDIDLGSTFHFTLKGRWKGAKEITRGRVFGGSQARLMDVWELKQRNSCTLRYDIPVDRLPNLEPLGFFGTLWEGMPYSFVLDWVSPVGDWLKALDANALAPYFLEGSASEIVKATHTGCSLYSGNDDWTVAGPAPARRFRPAYRFSRVLVGPWSVTIKPNVRSPVSLSHAAQGLSLLSQVLKRIW